MFGKKKVDVRLTEKQIKELSKTMSPKERRQFEKTQKEFQKKQRRKQEDAFFDGLIIGSLFFDD